MKITMINLLLINLFSNFRCKISIKSPPILDKARCMYNTIIITIIPHNINIQTTNWINTGKAALHAARSNDGELPIAVVTVSFLSRVRDERRRHTAVSSSSSSGELAGHPEQIRLFAVLDAAEARLELVGGEGAGRTDGSHVVFVVFGQMT